MTWASAATPMYFTPAKMTSEKDKYYISGDNIAMSPAMYSLLHKLNQNPDEKIRLLSIGGTNEVYEEIDGKVSVLDWATRLSKLASPVKKHTMDYMTEYLLRA